MLVNGEAGLGQYTEEAIRDERVRDMARRISVEFDEELQKSYPDPRPMVVEVQTTDGRRHAARVDYAKGDPLNPMTDAELCEKFLDVTDGILPEETAQAVIDRCLCVQGIDDTGELMYLVSGLAAPPAPLSDGSQENGFARQARPGAANPPLTGR